MSYVMIFQGKGLMRTYWLVNRTSDEILTVVKAKNPEISTVQGEYEYDDRVQECEDDMSSFVPVGEHVSDSAYRFGNYYKEDSEIPVINQVDEISNEAKVLNDVFLSANGFRGNQERKGALSITSTVSDLNVSMLSELQNRNVKSRAVSECSVVNLPKVV